VSPVPRHKARQTTKNVKQVAAARERALKASIAATEARMRADHYVDREAVIVRHKAWMAEMYADDPKIAPRGLSDGKTVG